MTEPAALSPADFRFRLALEALTGRVRLYRQHMAITRDDLKKKRLQAMAVVGAQMDANSDMFDRLIALGDKVADARTAAETAQTAALQAQIADLNEMADDLADMGNAGAAPPTGASAGAPSSTAIGAALPKPSTAALDTLMAAQPNPVKPAATIASEALKEGNAYVGTHGEIKPASPQP